MSTYTTIVERLEDGYYDDDVYKFRTDIYKLYKAEQFYNFDAAYNFVYGSTDSLGETLDMFDYLMCVIKKKPDFSELEATSVKDVPLEYKSNEAYAWVDGYFTALEKVKELLQ